MSEERQIREFRPYGAGYDLFWDCRDPEVLLEGPAGCGKTRTLLELVYALCTYYPGIRVLFLRNVKASLAESILPCWEGEVLWPGHPLLHDSQVSMENRRSYTFPFARNVGDGTFHPKDEGVSYEGQSHIVLGGLDKSQVEKTFSAQYDVICVFEAFEVSLDAWEKLFRANRNWRMPWQMMVADTNPGHANHWLNRRADQDMVVPKELAEVVKVRPGQKQMTRLCAKHKDNPVYWDRKAKTWTDKGAGYMQKLHSLSGARKERLLYGKWVTEEGLVFEDWHRGTHVIHGHLKREHGTHRLYVQGWKEPVVLTWFLAGIDWGFHPNPGVVQVWGMDQEDRRFLVAEIYRTQRQLDWWAQKVEELHEEFSFHAILCDGSRPENIDALNQRLGKARGRDTHGLARAPERSYNRDGFWQTGIDHIRFGLKDPMDGFVRLYVLSGCLREGMDKDLEESHRPLCFAQEMDEYRYLKAEDGKPLKEKEDPTCDAHAIDAARYVWTFGWGRDLTPKDQKKGPVAPGSLLDIMQRYGGDNKKRRRRRA